MEKVAWIAARIIFTSLLFLLGYSRFQKVTKLPSSNLLHKKNIYWLIVFPGKQHEQR
jgi:hypothetical protein